MEENQEPERKNIDIDDQSSIREYFGWGDFSLKTEIEQEKELEKQKRKEIRQQLLRKFAVPFKTLLFRLRSVELKGSKRVLLAMVTTCLFIILPVMVFAFGDGDRKLKEQAGQILPESFARESVQEIIYYPSQLPEGYKIDTVESVNEDVLVAYTITNTFERITFSQQNDVPITAFEQLFAGSKTIETDRGTAYIRQLSGSETIVGLRVENTTIFLSSKEEIDLSIFKTLIDGLEIIN